MTDEVVVTTQARRLCRDANGPEVVPGAIYEVDLRTGKIGRFVASYAATPYPPEMVRYTGRQLYRVSHGRTSERYAQAWLDEAYNHPLPVGTHGPVG